MLPEWMMNTQAWKSLKPQDRAVYIEVLRRFNGTNNGRLSISNRQAATACKISKDTACKCFQRLIEKGFIEIKTKSAFNVKTSRATEYAITIQGVDGRPATKNFASWRPPVKKKNGPKLDDSSNIKRTERTARPRFRIVGGNNL